MTLLPLAAALLLLGHLIRSRAEREERHWIARQLRRHRREQQWRAMIDEARRE